MEKKYYFEKEYKVSRKTNITITDIRYFEEATPMITFDSFDGFYDIFDEFTDESIGTYGVDSGTIGVFKTRDLKDKEKLKKEFLYTNIPNFKGTITLYSNNEEEFLTECLLIIDGTSNGKEVKYSSLFMI